MAIPVVGPQSPPGRAAARRSRARPRIRASIQPLTSQRGAAASRQSFNPVRIYVLHHPDSDQARQLAERIYEWFRLPSLDGLPVYVRSEAAPQGRSPAGLPPDWRPEWPLPPQGLLERQAVLEYLIPLVDARMVRDPAWHDYLSRLAAYCEEGAESVPHGAQGVLFPVALHPTAFNLPRVITRRNFIRHELDPHAPAAEERAWQQTATEETLKHLTEALARDLDRRVAPGPDAEAGRFKIFISYARADGTAIAKALRNYIQGETQCLAFLDENDIGYGQPFDTVLQQNVGGAAPPAAGTAPNPKVPAGRLARAMIVVNTDHYADRSWCRWEIDRFTTPRPIPGPPPTVGGEAPPIHVFDPVLVVDALLGPRVTRVLPELAQVPLVRWDANRARLCFSILMRQVVLGLRDVRVAQQVIAEEPDARDALFVNRLPGPVAIQRLLHAVPARGDQRRTIRYPGNGLSLIELRLLRKSFSEVRFRAFRDLLPQRTTASDPETDPLCRLKGLLDDMEKGLRREPSLREKVFAVSTSYSEKDLAAVGLLPRHQDEALLHLLRPLLRLGADLSYGGLPPKETAPDHPSATRNITAALLRLVSEERPEEGEAASAGGGQTKTTARRGPLLFNVCAWPRYEQISPEDEAAWINSYRILRFGPERLELDPFPHPLPEPEEAPPPDYQRYVALITSTIRARYREGFDFPLPGEPTRTMRPDAFIFMGGRIEGFSGIMPGIMEEFLHAAAADPHPPIYLFGGLGGAAGVIARALLAKKNDPRPKELTVEFYCGQPVLRKHEHYPALLKELRRGDPDPEREFDRLWALIRKHRAQGLRSLFQNGLDDPDNKTLLTTEDTAQAVRLAWKGISEVFLRQILHPEPAKPSATN